MKVTAIMAMSSDTPEELVFSTVVEGHLTILEGQELFANAISTDGDEWYVDDVIMFYEIHINHHEVGA